MFANGGKISASVLLSSAFILNSYQVFVIPDVISSSTVFANSVNKYGLKRSKIWSSCFRCYYRRF